MHKHTRGPWSYVFLLPVMVAGTLAVAANPKPKVVDAPIVKGSECDVPMSVAPVTAPELLTVGPGALDASPAATSSKCCDPTLEPGVGGNPQCFEGHTCCASGQWQCNNLDGTPSCSGGLVCGSTCGTSGASCSSNAECCSGQCKGNHKCR